MRIANPPRQAFPRPGELPAAGSPVYPSGRLAHDEGPAHRPAPYPDRDAFLAPTRGVPGPRPWLGVAARRPWDYPVVAAIVHLDQVELLEAVVETLRLQRLAPYIHVIDTGSTRAARARLETLELASEDVQVDYLNPRAWEATSVPVAVAMDHAFNACPLGAEFLYATHVDVFLKSRDYLSFLRSRCDALTPVVGYQMSDRSHLGTEAWRTVPSHTATLYHMPTMRRIRASWSMARAAERLGMDYAEYRRGTGKIDTETCLGLDLAEAGFGMRWIAGDGSDPLSPRAGHPPSWLCLGAEPNEPYDTPWLRHERSFTSHVLYLPELAERRRERLAQSAAECRARCAGWRADDDALRRAIACPDRSCPTGCGHAVCRRDWREVHLDRDCVPCKRAGA